MTFAVPRRPAPVALLVQANDDERDIYGRWLVHDGFRLLTARSAAEGFVLAYGEHPDVVIIDSQLRGGPDGFTFATKLRLDARTNQIRVIVLTDQEIATNVARAAAAGCDVLLTKPCLPNVLTQHARALLEVRNPTRAGAHKNSPTLRRCTKSSAQNDGGGRSGA